VILAYNSDAGCWAECGQYLCHFCSDLRRGDNGSRPVCIHHRKPLRRRGSADDSSQSERADALPWQALTCGRCLMFCDWGVMHVMLPRRSLWPWVAWSLPLSPICIPLLFPAGGEPQCWRCLFAQRNVEGGETDSLSRVSSREGHVERWVSWMMMKRGHQRWCT
jgi:hypothetical protein